MRRFLAAAVVAALCTILAQAVAPQVAATPVTIPFELATNHIVVKASVNKSGPLFFVLDTGAQAAIVRMDTAKKLGLSLEGTVRGAGAGAGTQMGSFVRGAAWSLADLPGFAQPVSVALPLPALPSALGQDIDGIVGGEFIQQFVVELDYQARTITLHDRAAFTYTGRGEVLPLDFNSQGHPVVKAIVAAAAGKPLERKFLLDIGSGSALILHSPFVAEQNLLGPQSKTIRAIGSAGAGGNSAGRLGRVESLQIGSFKINSPITMFSEDKAGAFANASLAGNIGAQIARRFRIFLDYGRKRIILEPSPAFAEPFDRAFSGLALRAEGPDFRTFRVREVLERSPAVEAGITEGDLITSIGGIPASSLTLSRLNGMLEKPVLYEISVRRADEVLKVTLTPKRLI